MKPLFYLALFASLALPLKAQADITRGCKAIWEVRVGTESRQFGLFEARGRCAGRSQAEKCQSAARGYAQACFRDAWAMRQDPQIRIGRHTPAQCLGQGEIRVRGYQVTDVTREIERHACALQRATPFTVDVIGRTWDGTRCGGELLISRYEITADMCGKS